jgi:DNA-binding NarL/FixJ family response regulator
MPPERIRVVLAEDGVLLREGLAGLLGRFGFEVVASVGDADALVALQLVFDGADHLVVVASRDRPPHAERRHVFRCVQNLDHVPLPSFPFLLSEYLEDDCPPSMLGRIQAHLGLCRDCQRFVSSLRSTVRLLQGMPIEAPSRELQERLRDIPRRA